jgi:hypothetical protein
VTCVVRATEPHRTILVPSADQRGRGHGWHGANISADGRSSAEKQFVVDISVLRRPLSAIRTLTPA